MTTWLLLLPLIIPFAGVPLTLALRKRRRVQSALALGLLLTALTFTIGLLRTVLTTDLPVTVRMGSWLPPFGIILTADPLGVFMVLMSQIVLSAGLIYSLGSTEKVVQYPTFYPLFLALATGLTGAFLTGDLFNLFVFAEIIVISGAVLTAIADDTYGVEAAYKYFYISTLASVLFLLGIGSLYVAHGTLNLADLADRIASNPSAPLTMAGMAFLTATFLIKSAAFPFHFWQPDFHAAAPTPVSAMLSSLVVKVGVYGFLRMTNAANHCRRGRGHLWRVRRGRHTQRQTHVGILHTGANRIYSRWHRLGNSAFTGGSVGLHVQSCTRQSRHAHAGRCDGKPRAGQIRCV